ncbi:unnamed protein product [Moneuplotes crassus]|uniref:Zinc finger PHD-type domain-containing protein n=1 Tax=Euplotes crassus TaxID=5936 RepID=A0AAD1UDI9_EUPCR|nr:unnamed protein product [Moneuplotes crassus]
MEPLGLKQEKEAIDLGSKERKAVKIEVKVEVKEEDHLAKNVQNLENMKEDAKKKIVEKPRPCKEDLAPTKLDQDTKKEAKQEVIEDAPKDLIKSKQKEILTFKEFYQCLDIELEDEGACSICEKPDAKVICKLGCKRKFHVICLENVLIQNINNTEISCENCILMQHPCGICGKLSIASPSNFKRCQKDDCPYYYHTKCLTELQISRPDLPPGCPAHYCSSSLAPLDPSAPDIIHCIRGPTKYHPNSKPPKNLKFITKTEVVSPQYLLTPPKPNLEGPQAEFGTFTNPPIRVRNNEILQNFSKNNFSEPSSNINQLLRSPKRQPTNKEPSVKEEVKNQGSPTPCLTTISKPPPKTGTINPVDDHSELLKSIPPALIPQDFDISKSITQITQQLSVAVAQGSQILANTKGISITQRRSSSNFFTKYRIDGHGFSSCGRRLNSDEIYAQWLLNPPKSMYILSQKNLVATLEKLNEKPTRPVQEENLETKKPLSGLKRTAKMVSKLFKGQEIRSKIQKRSEDMYKELEDHLLAPAAPLKPVFNQESIYKK